jgi:hypothetical protein
MDNQCYDKRLPLLKQWWDTILETNLINNESIFTTSFDTHRLYKYYQTSCSGDSFEYELFWTNLTHFAQYTIFTTQVKFIKYNNTNVIKLSPSK